MKNIISIILLTLMAVLTSCNKDRLIEQENKEKIIQDQREDKVLAKIERIEFNIKTMPFEVIDIDEEALEDELRGDSNNIRLTNKNSDKKPFLSIAIEDIKQPVYGRVVGAGDWYKFEVNQEANGNRRSAYKLTTDANSRQNLFIGWYDPVDRPWFFKENQYLCMFFNGEIYYTENYYDHANEGICLVKEGELTKRQIPLLTDLKKIEMHTVSGNGGDSPNTATFTDAFKPRGSLIAMRLINEVGDEITIKKIKFLQPHAIAYEGYFDTKDFIHKTGAGKKYNAYRYEVPFTPRNMNKDYEYPIYSEPESTDNLSLAKDKQTDGRIYVWGYPIKDMGMEPVIAQFEYTKASKPNKVYLSIPQKINPQTPWASAKAYRCNFKIKGEFDYETIFTDELRTELVAGITEEAINKMPDEDVWKEVALKLLNDSYTEAEFRIGNYKPYPNPWGMANVNKTNPYSILDNPTGIEVKKDDILELMVGDLNDVALVALRVQNLDKPKGDGFNGSPEYKLVKGINRIKMKTDGLVYLRYQTKNDALAISKPKIKIHIANGTVNGYFDSQNTKHTDRAKALLDQASGKYFDLVGKYAHLTMPTEAFRTYTSDLKKLIDDFDRLVEAEMELLGLFKYDKVFKNRMYFNVMYHSFMYATYYHTGYNVSTLEGLLNNEQFSSPTGGAWGPAHEVGHMNQTSKGMRWCGTMEVTNNIMSEYITTTIFKQPSRLQTENIEWGNNRYTKAWNSLLLNQIPFAYGSNFKNKGQYPPNMPEEYKKATPDDVFCQLVPFWQVQLYFGNVLGETPDKRADKGGFYPDVYEWVRTHEPEGSIAGDSKKNGLNQTELVYVMSKASGYDLTDFFEKWGFLSPINTTVYSYSTESLVVTQAHIDEVKARVQALGLPKPPIPLEYITDKTVELFKTQAPIVQGTNAYWSGIDLRIPDWQNVVVYEVWDKPYGNEGAKLVYIGDGFDSGNPNSTNAKLSVAKRYINKYLEANAPIYLYAVGVDNSRTEIPIN